MLYTQVTVSFNPNPKERQEMNSNRRVNPYRQAILSALLNRTSDEFSWEAPAEFNVAGGRRKYAIMLHGVCSYFRSRNPELKVNTHYDDNNLVTVKIQPNSEMQAHEAQATQANNQYK